MNMMLATADAANGGREDITGVLFLAGFAYLAFFSWLTISGWARQRRKEREAFYRHEVEKKIIEGGGVTADQLRGLRADEDHRKWNQRREGLKLAGLITLAIGFSVMVALWFLNEGKPVFHVGWIPITVGGVMLLYVYLIYSKFTRNDVTGHSRPQSQSRDNRTQ